MPTNAELLKAFIQTNKVAREKKAIKLGYPNAEAYIAYLKATNAPIPKQSTLKKTVEKISKSLGKSSKYYPTIHVIDILDKSGSMSGSKLRVAIDGINKGVRELLKESEVNYLYTLCSFSSCCEIKFVETATPLKKVKLFNTNAYGYTALYDAIGKTIEKVNKFVKKDEKVLINIYTDGEENDSRSFNSNQISEMIKAYSEKGYTVTFIGTERDVKEVKRTISIADSNTLTHNNTAESFEKAMFTNSVARSNYTNKVKRGEDVTIGFYKDLK